MVIDGLQELFGTAQTQRNGRGWTPEKSKVVDNWAWTHFMLLISLVQREKKNKENRVRNGLQRLLWDITDSEARQRMDKEA